MDFSRSDEWTVEPMRPGRAGPSWLTARRRWLLPRALAVAGALLFAFAAWAPWVTLTISISTSPDTIQVQQYGLDSSQGIFMLALRLLHRDVTFDYAATLQRYLYAWGGVTSLGVLLAPLLWQPLTWRGRRAPLLALLIWLGAATVGTLGIAATLLSYAPPTPGEVAPGVTPTVPAPTLGIAWGLALTLVALAALWSAAALLLREARAAGAVPQPQVAAVPVARRHRMGVGLLTAGVACWFLGFLAIPWVTVNCASLPLTLNHFAEGACGGLDSADALAYQVAQSVSSQTWNLGAGIYPLYGTLIGGGALLLVALWRHPTSRAVCGWAAVWLGTATVAAFLAYRGVGVVITHPPALTQAASGAWIGTTGVAVTLLGLLLAWAAILPLEGAKWWAIGAQSLVRPQRSPSDSDDGFEVSRL